MPALKLNRKMDVPFLFGDKGELSVETGSLQLNQKLDESTTTVFVVKFSANGDKSVSLGLADSVKIGVSVEAGVALTPVFASSAGAQKKLLKTCGIPDFFRGGNSDKVVLIFDAGGSAEVTGSGAFSYSVMKATVELTAGVNGGYTYARALDRNLPIEKLLRDYFSAMRLPEQGSAAPAEGEAIALRYGGYIRMGAEVSAGYSLKGTKSISLSQIALSENYNLSVLGKVGLAAQVAGDFSILVTRAEGLDNWARVRVLRNSSKSITVAADVNVGFKNSLDNLPSNADEFLGAALGVNAKSVLNVFQKARELSDFDKFKGAVDGLAKKYIGEFIGKGFDELSKVSEFTRFLKTVNKVVDSYESVGDRAVTLFDKYFDRVSELTEFLEKIKGLEEAGLAMLRKDLTPELWNILSQLTGGDPLGFLLRQVSVGGQKINSLDELKSRADSVLALIRDEAHAEIRNMVAFAKQSLGIDRFFQELAKIDTVDELEALANEKVGLFVSRLVGRTLDSSKNIRAAFDEVKAVLDRIDGFKDKLYKAFREAANSSYKAALHSEYTRASENESLIDVVINMNEESGRRLLAAAGRGDFEETLVSPDTGIVRLNEGRFTHRTRRESAFKVNIVGWHSNYSYEGFDRVITETEQRLVPSPEGITVLTTAKLEVDRERRRNGEMMHVNFLLRALAESKDLMRSGKSTRGYLIETLKSLTASYQLEFTDPDTSAIELRDLLAFAGELGMAEEGATLEQLSLLLPRAANGGFGSVEAKYDVRFDERAVMALAGITGLNTETEVGLRSALRGMVLANYLRGDTLHDVAFAYASAAVYAVFEDQGGNFTNHPAGLAFPVQLTIPGIAAPASVSLSQPELRFLETLYLMENDLIRTIKNLYKLLASKKPVQPSELEDKLGKFGDALKDFDRFDQTTDKNGVGSATIFHVFHTLVRLVSSTPVAAATLSVKSTVNGDTKEKLFLAGADTD